MSKTVIDSTSLKNTTSGGASRCSIQFADDTFTFSGTSGATRAKLTNIADPVNGSDAATRSFVVSKVSEVSAGLQWKDACRAKSTADIAGTYSGNQTIEAATNGALPAQDGVTMEAGDRLLVASQTDPKQNGIYTVTTVGDASTAYRLDRASDADSVTDLVGATSTILQGAAFATAVYLMSSAIDQMTDDKTFVQTSNSVSEFDTADGLVKTGRTVKVNTSGAVGIVADQVTVVAGGIGNTEMGTDAVAESNVQDGAISTAKVQSLAITNDLLAGQIQGTKLRDNTLTENLYGAQSIPSSAYRLRSIQSQNIGLAEVAQENLATGACGTDQIESQVVDGSIHIAPSSLISANYATNSVTDDALAPSSVGSAQLKANAVLTSRVANGQITSAKLDSTASSEAVTTDVVRDSAITQSKIAPSSIDETRLVDASVTNTKLADGSISSNKFGTLTALNVAGTITANAIQLGGGSSSSGTYSLAKCIHNHIDIVGAYHFGNGGFQRICDNKVEFDYDQAVICVQSIGRLVYQSQTGASSTLQLVLGVRFWQDATTKAPFTTPVAFDSFRNTHGDTQEHEALLQGFASDKTVGKARIAEVQYWARETGTGIVIPAGQDFIVQHLVTADDSNIQSEAWDGSSLSSV